MTGPETRAAPVRRQSEPKRLAPKEKKPHRLLKILLFLLAAGLLLGGSAGLLWASYHNYIELPELIQGRVDLLPDLAAADGVLDEVEVATGSYRLNMNVLPTVEAGSRMCNVEFENARGNLYDARLSLYRTDTGELLGHTHRVAVGKRVETLELNADLPVGDYKVTGQVELFQGDERVSVLPVEVTVRIIEKGAG